MRLREETARILNGRSEIALHLRVVRILARHTARTVQATQGLFPTARALHALPARYASLGRFNIFFYDGPHEERDQYDSIMLVRPALEKSFVLIIDDWNWRRVRLGTLRAIRDAGYAVASSIEIRTTPVYAHNGRRISDWHNGYFIAVLDGM